MRRREILGAGAVLLGGGVVGTAVGVDPVPADTASEPAYLEDGEVVYEREPLRLRAPTDTARRGGSIAFEVHHAGTSGRIDLGCNVPWAVQSYEEGTWNHVVWTDERWHDLCATVIGPGDTLATTVPLSAAGVADERGVSGPEADVTFTPGTHRFVLAGTSPPLAVNFNVLPAE
ncbi:hypothetical protein [Haloarcula litorea]|uniref:hypothetical protein n=1 Tax=Haloarcula litorea TaxID=3032579 RepID=UPI0023E7661F|nr:hypothetical protein [Halomicroarcula sp. GDY20]